jgi:hypothetical protein
MKNTRYIVFFLSLLVSTLFLSNCARLPKPSIQNKTILVVKDELNNTSKFSPQMRLKFNIKSSNGLDGNFYVMPSNGNAIISSLDPGKYTINGYTTHAIGQVNPRKRSTIPLSLKFELKANQITVLNRKVVSNQEPYSTRGGWTFNHKIKNVTSKEKQEVINLLRKDENFSLWSIYVENNYVKKSKVIPKTIIIPNELCSDGNYYKASKGKKLDLSNFLSDCGEIGHYNYQKAYSLLTSKPSLPNPKVSLPKVTVPTPKITDQSKKPQTIIIPTGSLGKMNESRIKILEKTLESKLDDYFSIVPKDLYEEAENQVWDELDSDECTVEQCNMMIREFLQVENSFQMNLIVDEGDTQISITWNDQDQKRVEEDYCEGCGTRELRKMIGGLVEKLVKGKN